MLLHSPRLDPFQLHLLWSGHIPGLSLSDSTGSIRQCPLSSMLCQFCAFSKAHPRHLLPSTKRLFLTVKSALAVYRSEQSSFRRTNDKQLSSRRALSRHVTSRRALPAAPGAVRWVRPPGAAGAGRGAESWPSPGGRWLWC